jgi:hypothetical protein
MDEAPIPERITLAFHRACGGLIETDGCCGDCRATPDASDYVWEDYVRAHDAAAAGAPATKIGRAATTEPRLNFRRLVVHHMDGASARIGREILAGQEDIPADELARISARL